MNNPIVRDIAITLEYLPHELAYLDKLSHEDLKDLHSILVAFSDSRYNEGYDSGFVDGEGELE